MSTEEINEIEKISKTKSWLFFFKKSIKLTNASLGESREKEKTNYQYQE